jgi:superfamily II DNA/RNA helicase
LAGKYPHSPELIVIAPSKELAGQIFSVCKQCTKLPGIAESKLKVNYLGGGVPKGKQVKLMESGVDVVIGTSGRIMELAKEGKLKLHRARGLVIDEADTMLEYRAEDGRGFLEDVNYIHNRITQAKSGVQTVLVSSTLKKNQIKEMQKLFGGLKPIFGPELHKTPATLKTNFVQVEGRDRMALLVSELKNHLRVLRDKKLQKGTVSRTIVFCNTVQSARAVGHCLDENAIEHFCLHGKIMPDLRRANMANFVSNSNPTPVLVATDVACRGLDFANVDHVILFDFPPSLVDFIHRSGRTARAGKAGLVTALVAKRNYKVMEQIKNVQSQKRAVPIDDDDDQKESESENAVQVKQSEQRQQQQRQNQQNQRQQLQSFEEDSEFGSGSEDEYEFSSHEDDSEYDSEYEQPNWR